MPPARNLRIILIAVAVVCHVAAGPIRAGAWTAAKGGSYHKLSVSYLVSDTEIDAVGGESAFQFGGEFTDTSLTYYGEYGLFDGLTVFGSVPLKDLRYENEFEVGKGSGLADIEIGVRRRLIRSGVALSLQGLLKIPGGYDGSKVVPLGNDQIDSELRLQLGHALGSGRVYFGVEAAYRFRNAAPSDERRALLEVGASLTERLRARLKYDVLRSVNNEDDVRDVFGNPLSTLAPERDQLEATLGHALNQRWGLEATYTSTVRGRSTGDSDQFALGVVFTP